MRWLVTVDAASDLDLVAERLESVGCVDVDTGTAIPLSDDELSIAVDGPRRLPELVHDEPTIKGVFNDSDVELYSSGPAESSSTATGRDRPEADD